MCTAYKVEDSFVQVVDVEWRLGQVGIALHCIMHNAYRMHNVQCTSVYCSTQ